MLRIGAYPIRVVLFEGEIRFGHDFSRPAYHYSSHPPDGCPISRFDIIFVRQTREFVNGCIKDVSSDELLAYARKHSANFVAYGFTRDGSVAKHSGFCYFLRCISRCNGEECNRINGQGFFGF